MMKTRHNPHLLALLCAFALLLSLAPTAMAANSRKLV